MVRRIHREATLREIVEKKNNRLDDSPTNNISLMPTHDVEKEIKTSDACSSIVPGFIVFSPDKQTIIGGECVVVIGGHPCACLRDGLTLFGRDEKANVTIRDPSVSRIHFSICVDGPQAFITDLGSTNGTYIDGICISKNHEIYDGDVIRAGGVSLSFASV